MALVTGKCIAARVIEPGERLTSTFLRVAGVGTESEPLRLAAVFRHADIADESHPAERIIQTNRCIEVLDTTLAQVEVDGASSSDIAFRLKQVLEAANSIATVSDAYYSAIVALKTGVRLVIAGIGYVEVWSFREGELHMSLEPTIMAVPNQRKSPKFLTGSLGLGFDAKKIQECEIRLELNEFVAIAMETDLRPGSVAFDNIEAPTDILDHLTEHFEPEAPLLIVITP